MRRTNIRMRILCLTLPALMALGLSACSLFGGKGEQAARDAARTPVEESLTEEGEKEPLSEDLEAEAPAGTGKEAEAPVPEAAGEKPAKAESAGAAGEVKEPERETPASEGKKENTPSSYAGGGKKEEQISQDDLLEPLPERGEAVKEPVQEHAEADPVIDDGGDTLLPEVP